MLLLLKAEAKHNFDTGIQKATRNEREGKKFYMTARVVKKVFNETKFYNINLTENIRKTPLCRSRESIYQSSAMARCQLCA